MVDPIPTRQSRPGTRLPCAPGPDRQDLLGAFTRIGTEVGHTTPSPVSPAPTRAGRTDRAARPHLCEALSGVCALTCPLL
jgi:hypothetical protein